MQQAVEDRFGNDSVADVTSLACVSVSCQCLR